MKHIFCILLLANLAICSYAQSKQSDEYFAKGIAAFNEGDYHRAIDWFSKSDALDQKQIPSTSCRAGYSKAWSGYCHHMLGDEEKARQVCPGYYSIKPADRRLTVESDREDDMANEAFREGDYPAALEHAFKCLDAEGKTLGKESLHYAGTLLTISNIYCKMNDAPEAIRYCDEGLSVLSKLGVKNDAMSFQFLHNRAFSYLRQNMVAMTFSDLDRLREISRYEATENANTYPTVLVDILESNIELHKGTGNDYEKATAYRKATTLAQEAFGLLTDSYSPDNEDIIASMFDCIIQMDMLGQYDLASELIRIALQKLENRNISRAHKGMLLAWLGDYSTDAAEAMKAHEQADLLLKDSPYVPLYYANKCTLANEYANNGDISGAIEKYESICSQYKKGYDSKRTYMLALSGLANLHFAMGNVPESNRKYKEIFSLLEYDKSNPDYILAFLKWIPVCVASWHHNTDPEKTFAVGFNTGKELREILSTINIHDLINKGIGVPVLVDALLPCYQALLSDATIIPGVQWQKIKEDLRMLTYDHLIPMGSEKDPLTCGALMNLAHVNYVLGDYGEAISLAQQVIGIAKDAGREYDNYIHDLAYYQYDSGDTRNAFDSFVIGYEYEKNLILKNYRWMTLEERTTFTNARRGNLDNIPHYAALTPDDDRYAALGYNALLFTKGLLLNSTIELHRLLQEEGDRESLKLLDEWRELNQKIQAVPDPDGPQAIELKEKAGKIEKKLMAKSRTYGDYTKALTVEYQDVQKGLGANDVAIEFFSFMKDAVSRQYGALVLTKGSGPKYIEIGCDSAWQVNDSTDYSNDSLFNSIFGNLHEIMPVRENGTVYFSADGILHTIALENLPGAEKYDMRRLSSTREIALAHDRAGISNMALFGGISYGLGEVAEYYNDSQGKTRGSGDFLEYLPGTRREADLIYDIMSQECKVSRLTDRNATELNFKRLSGTHPDILHIATHGFFNTAADQISDTDMLSATGLYLAGAQNSLWGMDTEKLKDDGILTAHEISLLDLRGLKLAVLSACDTGRGIIAQDGVFGLQRGFKQAGAQGILMSLWKVDDKATQLMMTEFYRNMIAGQSQHEALRMAQATTRSRFEDPKYWAAFILIDAVDRADNN